jgi:hypothetical protein
MVEFDVAEEIAANIKLIDIDLSSEDADAIKEALNEKLGLQDIDFTRDSSGNLELGDTLVKKLDGETLNEMLSDPSSRGLRESAASGMKAAAGDPEKFPKNKPTTTEVSNTSTEAENNIVDKGDNMDPTNTKQSDSWEKLKKGLSDKIGTAFKYSMIAGLSYGGLFLLGKAKEGCYVTLGSGKQVQLNNATSKDGCTCNNFKVDCNTYCNTWNEKKTISCAQQVCTSLTSSSQNNVIAATNKCAVTGNINPNSCQCYMGTNASTGTDSGLQIVWKKALSPFEVLGGELASIGYFIKSLQNDVLEIAKAGANAISGGLTIFLYVLGGAAAIGIVALIIYFIFKALKRNKAKAAGLQGGANLFSTSVFSDSSSGIYRPAWRYTRRPLMC